MTQQKRARVIFHVDMNSFYASVERAHHPEWRGKPLAIAGNEAERHGIIVTSSYEARRQGVRTTMTVHEALKICPNLIVKPPDFDCYRKTSDLLFQLLRQYTDQVEKASIDEGYMDLSQRASGEHPLALAKRLQQDILTKLKLPCSIGIAPNKFLAKMASDMKKPLGLTVLRKRDIQEKMWPLPIGNLIGVGKKTEEKLKRIGIVTIGILANRDQSDIFQRYGQNGLKLWEHANGIDARPVDPDAWDRYKSIGHSVTLPQDTRLIETIRKTLDGLSDKLEKKVKGEHVASYELTLVIRYSDWKTQSKQFTLNQPLYAKETILDSAWKLFCLIWNGQKVRLLGITLSEFQPISGASKQLDLFHYKEDAKEEHRYELIEQINDQFGRGSIQSASTLLSE
ncbi:DNA polymerase IV [Sporolactobacillus spathodeae]|uniref:DNA polymerase IV n=1 Tax=Sporolactobacillus spathodeae TaxID=1465502 RepID=A0ABS2Q7W9_9BACL|nr:DNA polymerase-4 [Sporolactobacillus spathodeae]